MGSTFVLDSSNKVKAFAGAEYPVPFYLQFVPGYVVEVVHGHDDLKYQGDSTINTIIALPHYSEDVHQTRGESLIGNKYRYFPLFRSMHDVPSKGDPVLLCTIGRINYYLGPLNTMSNSPTWNADPSFTPETLYKGSMKGIGKVTRRGFKGESLKFNKNLYWNRLQKTRNETLDYGPDLRETTGDTIIEGRHGNSLRIGSRDMNPYYGSPVEELPGGENLFYDEEEPTRIEIRNEDGEVYYDPSYVEIEIGEKVVWYNGDNVAHTVTATDGSFNSGDIDPYQEWPWTFEEQGTFGYFSDKQQDKAPLGNLTGKIEVDE